MPPVCFPNPMLSRTRRLETSCIKGTSSSMTSCSAVSAMAQNSGETASSPSMNALAPPGMPFRSAHRLPTWSPCWVRPPHRKVLIWLNHGAMTLENFSGLANCILAQDDCKAEKPRKEACKDWPMGASYPASAHVCSSEMISIGLMADVQRGRSGHQNARIACMNIDLTEHNGELMARLRISGPVPRRSTVILSPLTVTLQENLIRMFSLSVESMNWLKW